MVDEKQTNALYILDSNLKIIGRIENLAEEERIYSARLLGEAGYFVTFRQMDSLFAVDLKDPENPLVLSELKISGFSEYLHFYGENRLLGIGMEADEETGRTNGMKLSMFDISNPADVQEISKLHLSSYDHSEALYNHRAVMISTTYNDKIHGHLDGSKVAVGHQVKAGDVIGFMEKTGKATGTFLSLTVKVNGEKVNPILYLEMDAKNETIAYNGKEYKKSELCNATLQWLELSEQERSYSSYFPPEFMIFDETWGMSLNAKNITSTGLTIVCTQSGGELTGELHTGSWYILETWTK